MLATLAAVALLLQGDPLESFALKLQDTIHLQVQGPLERFFDRPDRDLPYLMAMGQRSGGLKTVRVVVLPAAPGWEGWGKTWAVLHTFQDCEQDHDMVMEVLKTASGYKLGREVPQWENGGAFVKKVVYHASLHPETSTIDVETLLDIQASPVGWAPLFRLNDIYQLKDINHGKKILSAQSGVIRPNLDTDFVQAGGVLIPWKPIDPALREGLEGDNLPASANYVGQLHLKYSGDLSHPRPERTDDQDLLSSSEACVASLWIPALGQLPTPVDAVIDGPAAWVVRGEGDQVGSPLAISDSVKRSSFHCALPISFPKIIGGPYQLAAKTTINGESFNVYQLPPIKPTEAKADLDRMTEAARFYEANLAPLPFHGYELYVSNSYYGIESYSHTILAAKDAFEVSHELGHTYFGGLAPCTYVHDTWNEGVTQYIDSIVLHHDEDKSLEAGLETIKTHVPLTAMPVPWSYENASYTRGAYVMHMLEAEITPKTVLAGLSALVRDRLGKDTKWDDLRPYFEKASGKDLKWFWNQWIDAASFPELSISDITVVDREKKFRTLVTITQSGTKAPYQMRFKLVGTVTGKRVEVPVTMSDAQTVVWIDSDIKPTEVHLEVFPDTLATVKSASHL
jgi:hypothetical protein